MLALRRQRPDPPSHPAFLPPILFPGVEWNPPSTGEFVVGEKGKTRRGKKGPKHVSNSCVYAHRGSRRTSFTSNIRKMSSPSKRRDMDVMKLMMSDYTVETFNDGISEFNVEFHGPKESPYEGGVWKVRVELPDAYPYKSPSIGFLNKIFHPNVDELSGSVCLDVINQSWSPMFDLLNVFDVFLPQLLLYPNPTDPLNGDAASLMMKDRQRYEQTVREHCEKYAKKENISNPAEESSEEDPSNNDDESGGSVDEEFAGDADP